VLSLFPNYQIRLAKNRADDHSCVVGVERFAVHGMRVDFFAVQSSSFLRQ